MFWEILESAHLNFYEKYIELSLIVLTRFHCSKQKTNFYEKYIELSLTVLTRFHCSKQKTILHLAKY